MSSASENSAYWQRVTWGMSHYWLIILYTLAFHYPLFLPGIGMPHWGDFYCFHSPMRIAAAQALHQGHMPFITQALFGGYPLYQDPQFAFFYPVNFLFALLVPNPNNEASLDGYILANLLILSISAVYFVRSLNFGRTASLAAAIIICMNGFVQMHITHINILQVMATGFIAAGLLARLAWSGGKRWRLALGAGLALAAGNLAGHPQTTLFLHYSLGIGMLVLAAMYWQRHSDNKAVIRTMGWSAVAVMLGVAIAAVQLLPTAHLLSICSRISMGRAEAMGEAMRLKHIPSLLFPGFYMPLRWQLHWPFYHPVNMYWISANPLEGLSFFGVIACSLGLVGFLGNLKKWPVHVLFWSAMFLLGAAMGEQLPIYGWLYDYVPMIKVVRVPSRVLWMFYTAWGLLAACGVRDILAGQAAPGTRRTLWLVLLGAWVAPLIVLGSYRINWSEAFLHLFVQNHQLFDQGVRENMGTYLQAIKEQGIAAAVIVTATALWLWLAGNGKRRRLMVTIAITAMAIELFYYGFCKSYIVDIKPLGQVETRFLAAFPDKPTGRAVVPKFIHGGGAINSAMQEGIWLANGYSVTYPEWVKAFEVTDVPPWKGETDKRRLDLWNVSDIVTRRRYTKAQIGGKPIDLDDWGWKNIGTPWTADTGLTTASERASMETSFTIDMSDLPQPVTAMYVIATADGTRHMPNGSEVATMTAISKDEATSAAVLTLRLGDNIADGRYSALDRPEKPQHDQAEVTFIRHSLWEDTDGTEMYVAPYAMPTTTALARLEFNAIAPYPASVGISQVIIAMADNSLTIKYPVGIGDFKEVLSAAGEFRLLHRDSAPGYVYMVPTAERGSYKKPGNIMARLYDPAFDMKRQVIVDKRKYRPDEAAQTDSAAPNDFQSTATISWPRPEEAIVTTQSNDKGWVVISMTWDEGWYATLDGVPIELARANGPHCAIPVPAGKHAIRLHYTPVYWWPGVGLSGMAILGCLTAMLWPRKAKYQL